MVETINSKRVLFPKGQQRNFLNKIISKISIKEAAEFCNLSERTIRDWRREKFLMNYKALKILCSKSRFPLPQNIELKNYYWYVEKGASKGGKSLFKKYGMILGDPEYRKEKWREWWNREGKYRPNSIINSPKPIKEPNFSEELAEFVGIMLGDGGIARYQITVTLNSREKESYGKFIVFLIKRLFNVPVAVRDRKTDSSVSLVVSRKKLVDFCMRIGLKIGNKVKQQIDIPDWIKRNKLYEIACVRGLMDTDGCVFVHRYKSKNKWYSYKKIIFTSASSPLRRSVFSIFKNFGLSPRLTNRNDVRIDKIEDVQRYIKIFGFHNREYLKRYQN